jgi:hypothetical protein
MASIISSIGSAFKAIRAALLRKGVNVGDTAGYPRVEVHSITEGEPMDKGDMIRSLTCVVESIAESRLADTLAMNDENLSRLLSGSIGIDTPWVIIGIVRGQAQQVTETTETNAILYRLIQNITVFIEKRQ